MKSKLDITKEDLLKLYIMDNKTVKQIAEIFSISTASVNRFLKLYEIKKPTSLKNQKISATKQAKSEDELRLYKQHLSEGRKGKGLGIEPWNKNKHTGNGWLGKKHSDTTKAKISQTKLSKSAEEKATISMKLSKALQGRAPWNKGLTYTMDPEIIRLAKEKETITKKLNGTYAVSNLEDSFYERLLDYFDNTEIYRQYFDINKYPFNCDFYIKPLDTYIELHGNWTHGYCPYNPEDAWCQQQLKNWEEKAISSDYYKNAIYTWTDLDVRKAQTAQQNNLRYLALYNINDIEDFFNILDGGC